MWEIVGRERERDRKTDRKWVIKTAIASIANLVGNGSRTGDDLDRIRPNEAAGCLTVQIAHMGVCTPISGIEYNIHKVKLPQFYPSSRCLFAS